MKQVPFWGPINIRRHHTHLGRHHYLESCLCAPLIFDISELVSWRYCSRMVLRFRSRGSDRDKLKWVTDMCHCHVWKPCPDFLYVWKSLSKTCLATTNRSMGNLGSASITHRLYRLMRSVYWCVCVCVCWGQEDVQMTAVSRKYIRIRYLILFISYSLCL